MSDRKKSQITVEHFMTSESCGQVELTTPQGCQVRVNGERTFTVHDLRNAARKLIHPQKETLNQLPPDKIKETTDLLKVALAAYGTMLSREGEKEIVLWP